MRRAVATNLLRGPQHNSQTSGKGSRLELELSELELSTLELDREVERE